MKIDQEKLIEFLKEEREHEASEVKRIETIEEIRYRKGWCDALKYVQSCVECNMIR